MIQVPYLLHDPVNLAVLGVDLLTHVQCHVTQIANDPTHLLQVLVHLVLPGIICDPGPHRNRMKDGVLDQEHREVCSISKYHKHYS